jgi:hypothetical protein
MYHANSCVMTVLWAAQASLRYRRKNFAPHKCNGNEQKHERALNAHIVAMR